MVEWYKWDRTTPLTITLISDEYDEDFSVWDNTNRRFMRNGMLKNQVGYQGNEISVEDAKWLKKIEWITRYGDTYRRATQYIYEVKVGDDEYKIGFTKSIHDAIQEKVSTLKEAGSDYHNYEFTVSTNGKSGLEKRYEVKMAKTGLASSPEESEKVASLNLTDAENKVVEAAKSLGNVNEQAFITFASQQNIGEDRAREIYRKILQ